MPKQTIDGESTTATVMTDQYDDNCGEQIRQIADHEAFENPIAIMPDCHYGSGAVIGFTMPVGQRVVPNTVGVDIGCGMTALNLTMSPMSGVEAFDDYEVVDERIRDAIPFGREVYDYDDQNYHIVDDFPWDECRATFESFVAAVDWLDQSDVDEFQGYGKDYFMDVCQRVHYDQSRAINSLGTLGGGNHFVEIAQSQKNGDYWVVVHSGSRGIGLSIAQHWQDKATQYTTARKNIEDVPADIQPYLKDNWKPDADAIRSEFEGEAIQRMFDKVSGAIQDYGPNADNRDNDLDWLEGDEALGYCIDMIFAQKYASESRRIMVKKVAEVMGVDVPEGESFEIVESTHNYIDFQDGVIRKGATKANEGERLIIPFNMAEGTILCRGKGNDEWNMSAPHGAGRRMSRTRAFSELDMDEFTETMDDVFSTSVTEETLDEAPAAYKDTAVIESVIEETAEIEDRWTPVMNLKAEE